MTISEQIAALKQIQLDLRTAIESKGVVVGDAPFADYPALVAAISVESIETDPAVYFGGETVTLGGSLVTLGGP